MHLQRRQVASLSASATTSSSVATVSASTNLIIVGAAVACICGLVLITTLLTLTYRRRYSRHARTTSGSEKGHLRNGSGTSSTQGSDYGSPINLRATAAFQNIWQSVDLGRNSLPHNMIVKPGEVGGLATILAAMNPPTNAAVAGHAQTDSGDSSTTAVNSSGSRSSPEQRNGGRGRADTELLDGYAAAQGGFDPDAQPLSAFSLHSQSEAEEEEYEEGECDLGEMEVVVVAGGEEVSQVMEGMQLAEFYVSGAERDEEGVLRMDGLAGTGYDSAPSPLYNEFSAGDAW